MQQRITSWLMPLALGFALLGCGEEPSAALKPTEPPDEPEAAKFALVTVQIDLVHHFPESEDRTALDVLREVAERIDFNNVRIDPAYQRAKQLRLIVEPAEDADAVYARVKERFGQAMRKTVEAELSAQQALVRQSAEDVQKYQQLMKRFQRGQTLVIEVNGARLDRRTLGRLLETTLATQIEAEQRVEELQQQIDRERYATLLRLR